MTANAEKLALSAVQSLCSLQTAIDEGDPVRGPLAQEALELMTQRLVKVGMLDILITIAARQCTTETEHAVK